MSAAVVEHRRDTGVVDAVGSGLSGGAGVTVMCYFYHRKLDFRHAEVEALAELVGCPKQGQPGAVAWGQPHGGLWESPFWYLTLPTLAHAAAIAERAMLVKGFFELWGEGSSWEEMREAVERFPDERKLPYLGEGNSFKVHCESFGTTFGSHDEMCAHIAKLCEFITFKGKVRLKKPDHTFWLFRVHSTKEHGIPEAEDRWYFGRQVAVPDRSILTRYELAKRAYIGTTSMEVELAHIMCNCGHVRAGNMVYDPFVGTGGLLVAAAHYGAVTLGMDIDIRVVRNQSKKGQKGERVDLYSNFKQYGLSDPAGLLRADTHRPPFRAGLSEWLDAIVCDPPYGIRESARKSEHRDVTIANLETYIPSTQPYHLGECLFDLVEFAARSLRVGGRLVYWMPSAPGLYEADELPCHPILKLRHNCEQYLTSRYTRRLMTLEKVAALDEGSAGAWRAARGDAIMKLDAIPKRVFEVMEKDEDGNPLHPELLADKKRFRGKQV